MGGDYLKKCQPQIAGEDVLWLVSSDHLQTNSTSISHNRVGNMAQSAGLEPLGCHVLGQSFKCLQR